jgi:23S rRNA pseudouridine2604 synthase
VSKNDADEVKKRAKVTITLKKPAEGAEKPPKATSARSFSTRAKAAARRDGRTLFEPAAPGTKAPSDPLAKPAGTRVPRPPRGTDAGGGEKKPFVRRDGAGSTPPRTPRVPRSAAASGRTGGSAAGSTVGSRDGSAGGAGFGKRAAGASSEERKPRFAKDGKTERSSATTRSSSARTADTQARRRPRTTEGDAVSPPRKMFVEPRRGGKLRDQAERDERAARPVEKAVVAAEPRDADGKVRVSKLLSEQGLCSRREADSYIARGWVWADGVRVTELGTRVLPTAKLKLDQNAMAMQDQRVTVLLHKPVGYVSGQAEDGYQPASVLVLPEHQIPDDVMTFRHEHRRGMAPAGRLDIDSTGLLVLTQDGRIAKLLIGENSEIEKEYLVRVEGELSAEGLALLNHGLSLDGEALRPAKVKWQNKDQLNFILREGKKRQIRRMCEAVGLVVVGLKRIRIGRVMLGDLPAGKWRYLREDEAF